MKEKLFEEIIQIAIVVEDLKKSLKIFNDEYGIGPWEIYKIDKDTTKEMKRNGENKEFEYIVAMCEMGDVELELVQPVDENSVYYEFLKNHGPGLHHIGFKINDFNKVIEFFNERGIIPHQSGIWKGKFFAHMKTEKDLNFVLEIFNKTENYEKPEPIYKYPEE